MSLPGGHRCPDVRPAKTRINGLRKINERYVHTLTDIRGDLSAGTNKKECENDNQLSIF